MKQMITIAVAGMLATSSLAGLALAQDPSALDDGVTIIRLDSLNNDSDRGRYRELQQRASNPDQMAEAQSEIEGNADLKQILLSQSVQIHNVVEVETAANGGKIVYVR